MRYFIVLLALTLAFPAFAQSPEGAILNAPSTATLVTVDGTWSFGAAGQSGGYQILLDGNWASSGSGNEMEVANCGHMFVKNSVGNWYGWNNGSWQGQGPSAPTLCSAGGGGTGGGTTTLNTIWNGTGVPVGTLGSVGDFYVDTAAHVMYGPKVATGWTSSFSLVGPPGAASSGGSGCTWHTRSFTDNPHPVSPTGDDCNTMVYKGTADGVISLPAAATVDAGFIACYQTETAPIVFKLAGAADRIEGSPATVYHGDNPACPQVDSDGVWDIEGGAVSSIVNPANPAQ